FCWLNARPAFGLRITRKLLSDLPRGSQRGAALQLHAAQLCEVVLGDPNMPHRARRECLKAAQAALAEAYSQVDVSENIYWQLIRTSGVTELAMGNLRQATKLLLGAAWFTKDIVAHFHLGMIA